MDFAKTILARNFIESFFYGPNSKKMDFGPSNFEGIKQDIYFDS